MDIEKLKYILNQVKLLSKHYEQIAAMSGENFNVFKILNVESSEVRLHSSMLAEFLNPKGSHGQGDVFLKVFVNLLNISDFDTQTAEAFVEKDIGPINKDYTHGGRIDILVVDGNGKKIIIENKIYATDQPKQLLRYYNHDKSAYLFYLTLDGKLPNDCSLANEVPLSKIGIISYKIEIIEWLEKLRKEATATPIIRETIVQYINLIKVLTNQTSTQTMKEEIKKLLLENPDFIESLVSGYQALESIVSDTASKFRNLMNEKFKEESIYSKGDLDIYIHWGSDGDGVFIGYYLKRNNVNISGTSEADQYKTILKNIYGGFISNQWHIGWYNPVPFKRGNRFEGLDKKLIAELSNERKLQEFVQHIVEQELKIRATFFEKLNY